MRLFPVLFASKNRSERRPTGRAQVSGSRPATVKLGLEALEERWLLNATVCPASPPPSFTQAAFTLFVDGINLGSGQVNQYVFHLDENLAYRVPPAELNASIASNAPYVGPFAQVFVLAGELVGIETQYQLQIAGFQAF